MKRLSFMKLMAALAGMAVSALSSMTWAQAQMPALIAPERVSLVTVTPVTADAGVPRQITISGHWPGCVPVGASVAGASVVAPSTLVVKLILPLTLVACPAAILPYSVTTTYTPSVRGIIRLLVLNFDGEYLAESKLDTRAPTDHRSAFNITGMWFDPQSNGSGLTFVHSRVTDNVVFGTWYVYDGTGKPRWYTIQNTEWKSQGRVMEGWLYHTSANANCPLPFTACPAAIGLLTIAGKVRITLTGTTTMYVEALASDGTVIFTSNAIRVEI